MDTPDFLERYENAAQRLELAYRTVDSVMYDYERLRACLIDWIRWMAESKNKNISKMFRSLRWIEADAQDALKHGGVETPEVEEIYKSILRWTQHALREPDENSDVEGW